MKTEYATNLANDVKLWTVTASGATASYYAAGKLYKTTLKDENWTATDVKAGTTDEYKDFEGRVVLKKVWKTDAEGLSTYYVYDDFGNLRYVLPPAVNEGTDRLSGAVNSFIETDAEFRNFMYGYHYDGRNRLIEKKLPGKEWECMVYNSLDQVILTQDWKQMTEGKWLLTKYDAFGRVIQTGLYNDGRTRPEIQTAVDNLTVANPNYIWWEEKSASGVGYTNNVFPQSISYHHSVNYYDDYDFPGNVFGQPNPTLGQVQPPRTKGLLTGSSITVLGTGSMLLTVNYYDAEGRVIQSKGQHYKNNSADVYNYDEVNNVYSFTGELKESTRRHFNNNTEVLYVYNKYTYDHMGRKLSTEQKTANTLSAAAGLSLVKLSGTSYNETGQLLSKGQHSIGGSSFLQSTGYTYNERGWLKTSSSNNSSLFSMELKYQDAGNPLYNQYNGNISQQVYTNNLNNTFTYTYDKLNRLEASSAGTNLGETISYDVMGNIKTLSRDGYGTNDYHISQYVGNQLKQISGFTNGSYTYNDNGNLTVDGPNGNTISYNYLNLPMQVTGSQNVTYLYDAGGNKLRKSGYAGATDYIDGIHYKPNGDIDFVQTQEGTARNNSGVYSYEYNQTDHLGNVRLSFYKHPSTELLEVLQRDDYYAFGQRKAVGITGLNKYLYNGKELQEELGTAGIGQFDYGARFYDPVIGRFSTIDPLSEVSRRNSPYNYALNNPIRFIDVDGMYADDPPDRRPWLSMSIRPDPDGDQIGLIKNATAESKQNATLGTAILEATHMIAESLGINALDNLIFSDEKITAPNAILTGIAVFQGMDAIHGGGPKGKSGVLKYDVGPANELRPNSVGDGLDIHHTPQSKPASQVIADYDPATAPAIAITTREHRAIPTRKGEYSGTARSQLAKDIYDLRGVGVPNSPLLDLIQLNRKMYPEMFKK